MFKNFNIKNKLSSYYGNMFRWVQQSAQCKITSIPAKFSKCNILVNIKAPFFPTIYACAHIALNKLIHY